MHPVLTATTGLLVHRIAITGSTFEKLSEFQYQFAPAMTIVPQSTQDRSKSLGNRTSLVTANLTTGPVKQLQIFR